MRIKNVLLAIISTLMLASCAGASNKANQTSTETTDNPKAVVCYFSATGTTKAQAQRLAEMIGADIHEITANVPYTEADLDWRDKQSRSTIEMNDSSSRPALGSALTNVGDYDIVFVGYPNWWNTAPRIINTFIESYDLAGKTIVPFMTSGGSDITNSEKDLAEAYPTLKFAKGLLMNGVSDEDIIEWVKPLGVVAKAGNN